MNENGNNFESLRRLLALKRHETPPPGFFENFSGEVMVRIRVGEARAAEQGGFSLAWLSRLVAAFEAKPAWSGAFASALCLLLLLGIVYAERPDMAQQPLLTTSAPAQASPLAVAPAVSFSAPPSVAPPAMVTVSSTNPIFDAQQYSPAWFGAQPVVAQPVNFTLH